MVIKLNIRAFVILWTLICIFVFPSIGQPIYASQGFDTSAPDSAHCTSMGYLYTTVSGVNNGKPICQFPDGTSCDAHSFFLGNCTFSQNSYSNAYPYNNPLGSYYPYNNPQGYNPYFKNDPQGALDIADATKNCEKMGGSVGSVHTPYGDLNLCNFPYGGTIDLSSLVNGGFFGGPYSGIYGGYPSGYNGYYLTFPWLNSP
jgi:putative hemolysin